MAHREPQIRPPVSFKRKPTKGFQTADLFALIAEMQADLKKHPPSSSAKRAAAILEAHRPKAKPKGPRFPAKPPPLKRPTPIAVNRPSTRSLAPKRTKKR